MKKHIILCLMAMFYFVGQSYAQNDQWRVEMQKKHKQQINDTLTNAKYVFEGKVIKRSYYFRNGFYTSSVIVKVEQVFRGKLQIGTVEIVVDASNIPIGFPAGTDISKIAREVKIYNGKPYIYICKDAKKFPFDSKYNIDTVDNKKILTPYENIDDIALNTHDYAAEGLDTSFYTKGELYRYLGSFPHMKMPTLSAAESGDWEKPILLPRGSTHGMDTTFSSPRDFNTYQRTHKMVNRSDFYQDSIRQVNVAKEAKRLKEKQQNDSIVAAHHQQFLIRNQQKKMRNDSLKRIDSLNRINLNTLPATNSSTTASAKTSRLKDDSSPTLMLLYNGTYYNVDGETINYLWDGSSNTITIPFIINDPLAICNDVPNSINYLGVWLNGFSSTQGIVTCDGESGSPGNYYFTFTINNRTLLGKDEISIDLGYPYSVDNSLAPCGGYAEGEVTLDFFLNIQPAIPVTGININSQSSPCNITIDPNIIPCTNCTLTLKTTPSNATIQTASWVTYNTSIVSVSPTSGSNTTVITPIKATDPGNPAIITAISDDFYLNPDGLFASCSVTVKPINFQNGSAYIDISNQGSTTPIPSQWVGTYPNIIYYKTLYVHNTYQCNLGFSTLFKPTISGLTWSLANANDSPYLTVDATTGLITTHQCINLYSSPVVIQATFYDDNGTQHVVLYNCTYIMPYVTSATITGGTGATAGAAGVGNILTITGYNLFGIDPTNTNLLSQVL